MIKRLYLRPLLNLNSFGIMNRANPKKLTVIITVVIIFDSDKLFVLTSPVAIAIATHRRISCRVAVPNMIFAKRVCMMPKSRNIFDMTGIEVIATAMAMMIVSAGRLDFDPR